MKSITTIRKKLMAVAMITLSVMSASAQEQTWNFNADETADYAAFFKQPSAIDGKCNAEALGIDINREGFSWDDMNTWKNVEGKIWHSFSSTFAETVFGVVVNTGAAFGGKTSSLSWTNTEGDNKWYPLLPAVQNLKGTLVLRNFKASTIHISNTQIDTVKIQMTNGDGDCYLHIRRNPNVKQIDLSGSTGKCRQLAGYKNALSDETALIAENCRQTEFLDWLLNLEDNNYTFSTIPLHPITGKVLASGYAKQWNTSGGLPVGIMNGKGEYEIVVDEDVDLSAEYDVQGQMTQYTWKDEDGETINLPTFTPDGWFTFDQSCVGKTYRCEMTNAAYPALMLNTVWAKVVAEPTGIATTKKDVIKVGPNPVIDILYINAIDVESIDIFNITGANVKSVIGSINSVDISNLPSGVYVVKVKTATDEAHTKIVKK